MRVATEVANALLGSSIRHPVPKTISDCPRGCPHRCAREDSIFDHTRKHHSSSGSSLLKRKRHRIDEEEGEECVPEDSEPLSETKSLDMIADLLTREISSGSDQIIKQWWQRVQEDQESVRLFG